MLAVLPNNMLTASLEGETVSDVLHVEPAQDHQEYMKNKTFIKHTVYFPALKPSHT